MPCLLLQQLLLVMDLAVRVEGAVMLLPLLLLQGYEL